MTKLIAEFESFWRNTSAIQSARREKSRQTSSYSGQNYGLLGTIRGSFASRKDKLSSKKTSRARTESLEHRKNSFRLSFGGSKAFGGSFKAKGLAGSQTKIALCIVLLSTMFSFSFGDMPPAVSPPKLKGIKHRLTVYYPGQDKWTTRLQSASGYTLRCGVSVATDLKTYDFKDKILIEGVGQRIVHDTGTAVKRRTASGGKYPVIDIFFKSKTEALKFANRKKYAMVYLVQDQ